MWLKRLRKLGLETLQIQALLDLLGFIFCVDITEKYYNPFVSQNVLMKPQFDTVPLLVSLFSSCRKTMTKSSTSWPQCLMRTWAGIWMTTLGPLPLLPPLLTRRMKALWKATRCTVCRRHTFIHWSLGCSDGIKVSPQSQTKDVNSSCWGKKFDFCFTFWDNYCVLFLWLSFSHQWVCV